MRFRRVFPALHLYPSDTTRTLPTRAGMRWLRHKSRHSESAPYSGSKTGVGWSISVASRARNQQQKFWGPLLGIGDATSQRLLVTWTERRERYWDAGPTPWMIGADESASHKRIRCELNRKESKFECKRLLTTSTREARTLVLEFGSVRNRIEQFLKNFALALGHSIAEDGEFLAIAIPLLVCGFILFVIGMALYEVVLDAHATTTATLDSLSINPDKWISR